MSKIHSLSWSISPLTGGNLFGWAVQGTHRALRDRAVQFVRLPKKPVGRNRPTVDTVKNNPRVARIPAIMETEAYGTSGPAYVQ